MRLLTSIVIAAILAAAARADVTLPSVIGDRMVLQRGREIPVWGWAAPGEAVTVTLRDQKAETTAGDDGRWQVRLKAMAEGGPHELVVVGKNTITLKDVLVGEVWLCSGQSNMEWTVSRSTNPEAEAAAATAVVPRGTPATVSRANTEAETKATLKPDTART